MLYGLFLLFFFPLLVQAHTNNSSNGLRVTVHTTPDDSPIAGEPSTVYILFEDERRIFSLKECDCSVRITLNGKEIFSSVLTPGVDHEGADFSSIVYTFPTTGIFSVHIEGAPSGEEPFESFTFEIPVRVERENNWARQANQLEKLLFYVLVAGIPLAGFIVLSKHKGRKAV